MTFAELCSPIFVQSINDYHKTDNVDTPISNPYPMKSIEYFLYLKNWIDTVRWHFEDIIRNPKINQEVERTDTSAEHLQQYQTKLNILLEQQKDLSSAIDQLISDIESGNKYMKVYKQMKMYNDPNLSPVLYGMK